MKKLIILVVVVLVAVILGGMLWGQYTTMVSLDEKIKSKDVANQSEYDNMWKSFKETAQVTSKQAADIKAAYLDLITGRYQDSNLLFKTVKEDNPKMDTSLYNKLMDNITAGRKTFNNCQKQISDIVGEYNQYLRSHPLVYILGFKEKDARSYIITSARTDNAYKTGQDEEVDLMGDK